MPKFKLGDLEIIGRKGTKVPFRRYNPYSAPSKNQFKILEDGAVAPEMHVRDYSYPNFYSSGRDWEHDDRFEPGVDYDEILSPRWSSFNRDHEPEEEDDVDDTGKEEEADDNGRMVANAKVQLVHSTLAENGPLSPKEIYDVLQKENRKLAISSVLRNIENEASMRDLQDEIHADEAANPTDGLFENVDEIQRFLHDYPFIFKRMNKKKYINYSFGHRRAVVRIAGFLRGHDSCRRETLFTYIKNNPQKFYAYAGNRSLARKWDEKWMMEEEITFDSMNEWLEEQPAVFRIHDGRVYLANDEISSRISWRILPDDDVDGYYDKSREFDLKAKVVTMHKHYLKAEVWDGVYVGREIFVLSKHVGIEQLNKKFNDKDEVDIRAFISINHKLDFTASSIALSTGEPLASPRKHRRRDGRYGDKPQVEKMMISSMDRFLDAEIAPTELPFDTMKELWKFVRRRKHLYDAKKRSHITVLDNDERQAMLSILEMVKGKKLKKKHLKAGENRARIFAKIKSNALFRKYDDDKVKEFIGRLKKYFKKRHGSTLKLKGSYHGNERVYLV